MAGEVLKDPREGHRQRLRDKFMAHGLAKMTDAEVLELLLSFGTPRRDCKLAAKAMLEKCGTIRDVFEASPEILSTIKGAGPANIVAIKFIHAVSGKYLEQRLLGRIHLNNSREIVEYLRYSMEYLEIEVFKMIYLNHANEVLKVEDTAQGSVSSAGVSTRAILDEAVALRATCLICAHNHPSGRVEPSENDQRFTRRLVHLTSLAEMKVLDHLIMGKNGRYFSFNDFGLIASYEREVRKTYGMAPSGSGVLFFDTMDMMYTDSIQVSRIRPQNKGTILNASRGIKQTTDPTITEKDSVYAKLPLKKKATKQGK